MKSNLPAPCHRCEPYGGTHTLLEGRGMVRCDCKRGKLLAKGDKIRSEYREMDLDDVRPAKPSPAQIRAARQSAEALEDIPGYVRTETSMTFLADELMSMARSVEQLQWLVRRARRLYRKWPGARELRVLFCSRFMPKDGFELQGSDVYPEGIPSERPAKEIDWKQIEAGRVVSIEAGIQQEIAEAAKQKRLPAAKQSKVSLHDDFLPAERRSALP